MASNSQDLLNTLQNAANDYFDKEEKRLNAQFNFLDAIGQRRAGNIGLQDANAQGASQILANSITDYLGKPLGG